MKPPITRILLPFGDGGYCRFQRWPARKYVTLSWDLWPSKYDFHPDSRDVEALSEFYRHYAVVEILWRGKRDSITLIGKPNTFLSMKVLKKDESFFTDWVGRILKKRTNFIPLGERYKKETADASDKRAGIQAERPGNVSGID